MSFGLPMQIERTTFSPVQYERRLAEEILDVEDEVERACARATQEGETFLIPHRRRHAQRRQARSGMELAELVNRFLRGARPQEREVRLCIHTLQDSAFSSCTQLDLTLRPKQYNL